ncbi:MAG: DUF1622 domain-containing protein [Erysipelotrichaceae bacterium]|nr:DUF1622 domain-containing protein [Erysipelotrichaceae bacterium]MDP3304830.1 DUF1622 domain-containing protein [Erysipelotrichaceae bacterium]
MEALYKVIHLFVIDLTKLLMLALELTGATVIIIVSFQTLSRFARLKYRQTSTELRIRLGRGIALGLLFYLAAEVLRLITIRDYTDLAIVSAIIVLHVIVSVLVSWEVSHSLKHVREELEYDHDLDSKL